MKSCNFPKIFQKGGCGGGILQKKRATSLLPAQMELTNYYRIIVLQTPPA